MPIRPYLAGRTFAPEIIVAMSTAFEEACKALNVGADSPTRAMVARMIILLVGGRPHPRRPARCRGDQRDARRAAHVSPYCEQNSYLMMRCRMDGGS